MPQDEENVVPTSLDEIDPDDLIDPGLGAKVAAPLIALGATWAVREVLEFGYKKITGHEPPHANDPTQRMSRIILWAATTAAAMAVVSVVIDRMTAPKLPD